MESRFDKYETEGKNMSNHIANINNYIDMQYNKGLTLIEKEIQDLQARIDAGNAPVIFSHKVKALIWLGKAIEKAHELYHFNKGN